MRRRAVRGWLTAASLAAIAGCGTVGNLYRPDLLRGQRVYGGVRADVEIVRQSITGKPESQSEGPTGRCISAVIFVADLPLSAVADTLTLPFTIPATLVRQRDKRESAPAAVDPSAKPFSSSSARGAGGTAEGGPSAAAGSNGNPR